MTFIKNQITFLDLHDVSVSVYDPNHIAMLCKFKFLAPRSRVGRLAFKANEVFRETYSELSIKISLFALKISNDVTDWV